MKAPLSSSTSSSSGILRRSRLSTYLYTLLAFIVFVAVIHGEYSIANFGRVDPIIPSSVISTTPVKKREKVVVQLPSFAVEESEEGCDIFSGKWVKDELTRPHYGESECPYIQPQLTCRAHGRPDTEYQKWRWQPHGCDIPRFNATLMLESLRGKRMMFVGDSLNRGQYVSMVCLLHRLIPEDKKSMETYNNDALTVFRVKDYNATIEFYWAPFLLESNSDNAVVHRISDRIVRKGSMNKHGRHWKGVDILVFNTYLWWVTGQDMKILYGHSRMLRKK
uniref:Uncharacterized protein n=1 Tax=Gossypium raimondii TaxID=29730 RepID=A0A0D2TF47_GOSRA|nr:hypothetical protein B456_011G290400 [Gossypium raimondii]